MIKQLIIIGIFLFSLNIVSAGEIVTEDNNKVFIYGNVEEFIYMSSINNNERNFNRTLCVNATVIEGEISIAGSDNYELEYEFTADINDSAYISRILIIKQDLISSGLLVGKTLNRTLTLDGVIIGNYETKTPFWGKTKKNSVYFNLIDNNIHFGSDIIINQSLAFTQLDYIDQQTYLPNVSQTYPKFPIYHKYISVSADGGESTQKLSGITGIIYNVLGNNILTEIPYVGKNIKTVMLSIQSLLFLPLSILQFIFNLIFSFLVLISSNFWYALMTIEIMCMIPTFKYDNYADVVQTYIKAHVSIFIFIYEKIILTMINLILRLIEIIRNMFRI
jgi:hypothetical protein